MLKIKYYYSFEKIKSFIYQKLNNQTLLSLIQKNKRIIYFQKYNIIKL